MKTSDFYYDLPEKLIAQTPIEPRDSSRLMVMDKSTGELSGQRFYEIENYLNEGDLLVVNTSKVIPARLFGVKEDTQAKIELLLLNQLADKTFETLVKPAKKTKIGTKIIFSEGKLEGVITQAKDDGNRVIEFKCDGNIYEVLDEIGHMPLPPYITEKLDDKDRYQTVYSKQIGSSAAPTAGLHFTEELLERLKNKGIKVASVVLHVGLGTFRPVKVDDVTKHKMHSEHYMLSEETACLINQTKKDGGRVIAVGTTSCRTLESATIEQGKVQACEGDTQIFIYPPYEFKVVDGIVTNFHLPESTLIMLISAFSGYDNTMNAYTKAVEEDYRFFSFGDAMLIL